MDTIQIFLDFLGREKGQGERTKQTNLKIIRKILRVISPLTSDVFQDFIDDLLAKKASPSYIKQHVGIVRQWGECFKIEELKNFPYPKITYKSDFERSTFSDKEMLAFLNLPNPNKVPSIYGQTKKNQGIYHAKYERWQMFYILKFYHGLRDWETARLTVNMMDFGIENAIKLPGYITKTKKPRKIPFSPAVREKIHKYVQEMAGEYLFPNPNDFSTHILQDSWKPFFNNQIKRLGIKRDNLTSYSTRHTYGTRQASRVPLKTLSKLMGHERVSTTEIYIHPTLDDFREAQNNDRILEYDKNGRETLIDIHKEQKKLEEKYRKKIHTTLQLSEDGRELVVVYKVRRKVIKSKYNDSINLPSILPSR